MNAIERGAYANAAPSPGHPCLLRVAMRRLINAMHLTVLLTIKKVDHLVERLARLGIPGNHCFDVFELRLESSYRSGLVGHSTMGIVGCRRWLVLRQKPCRRSRERAPVGSTGPMTGSRPGNAAQTDTSISGLKYTEGVGCGRSQIELQNDIQDGRGTCGGSQLQVGLRIAFPQARSRRAETNMERGVRGTIGMCRCRAGSSKANRTADSVTYSLCTDDPIPGDNSVYNGKKRCPATSFRSPRRRRQKRAVRTTSGDSRRIGSRVAPVAQLDRAADF